MYFIIRVIGKDRNHKTLEPNQMLEVHSKKKCVTDTHIMYDMCSCWWAGWDQCCPLPFHWLFIITKKMCAILIICPKLRSWNYMEKNNAAQLHQTNFPNLIRQIYHMSQLDILCDMYTKFEGVLANMNIVTALRDVECGKFSIFSNSFMKRYLQNFLWNWS